MPLVPRCAERETASAIVNQRPPQLMREPWAEPSLYFRGRRLRLGNMVDPKYTLGASVLKSYLG
jgi:hypothetical protein